LPDELQQRLDERIGLGVVGDLGRYAAFQSARAIPIAAAESGGAAGAGVGLGAGVAMGQTMMRGLADQGPASTPPSAPSGNVGNAGSGPANGGAAPAANAGAASAPDAGQGAAPGGASGAGGAGIRAVFACARCDARLDRATRFCPECGNALVV
jgi:membrane protease subunit (stomatin/prohibitin family)